MTTTVLFVEHLMTGIQAAAWIVLIAASYFGPAQFKLEAFKDLDAILAFIVLSIVYPVGVFVDNLADFLLKDWSEKIRDERMHAENLQGNSLIVMKVLKDADDDYLKAYVGYVRTRMRISRSAALNFALITISSLVFTATRLNSLPQQQFWKLIVFETAAGTIITTSALLSWRSITKTFTKQLVRASKVFGAHDELLDGTEEAPELVAKSDVT